MPVTRGETLEFSSRISRQNAFCDGMFRDNRPHNHLRFQSKLMLGHHCYQRAVFKCMFVYEKIRVEFFGKSFAKICKCRFYNDVKNVSTSILCIVNDVQGQYHVQFLCNCLITTKGKFLFES